MFANFIRAALTLDYSMTTDHPTSTYNFPHHITPTDLRPDIVWWSDQNKKFYLFKLTISFESSVAEAHARKQAKYAGLVKAGKCKGYSTVLITIKVGSRGMLSTSDLYQLTRATKSQHRDVIDLCHQVIQATLLESHTIWCSRNTQILFPSPIVTYQFILYTLVCTGVF